MLLLMLSLTGLCSCEYFEYHPYDTDIHGDRHLTAAHTLRIETEMAGREEFCFAVVSDTQGFYDETEEVVDAINARGDVDFVVHCGDLSDFGLKKEFQFQRDILSRLSMPYVALIGNHDCLGTGRTVYETIYGDVNFAFTAGNTRFICLNTNAMEFDYSTPVPDFDFLDEELHNLPPEVERVVYCMHVRPGEFQFNNNVKHLFQSCLHEAPGTPICLYGHEHSLRVDDLFEDGILYYQCPNIGKRCYLLFRFTPDHYTYEAITF